jgi:O-glycosyl hydrolase
MTLSRWARLLPFVLFAACGGPTDAQLPTGGNGGNSPGGGNQPLPNADVRIEVKASSAHQVMEGFGATTLSLVYANGTDDKLPAAIRTRALQALYGDVKLTMGNTNIGRWEPNNDNADPMRLNEAGVEMAGLEAVNQKLLAPARALGADGLYPGNVVNLGAAPWLEGVRTSNYSLYIDECAEFIVGAVLKWRDVSGQIPKYHALFNEALWGNQELKGGGTKEMVDIVKRAGARLRSAGMPTMFVVGSEYSPAQSLTVAREILSDPAAREYVGAIGYHPYPYGSAYASMPNILAGPGTGRPNEAAVAERTAIKELGRQYNVPVWMTEVSHGELDPRSMDALRARAIHIHDELAYADASAFFAMNSMWDSQSNAEHFPNGSPLLNEDDTIVLIDLASGSVLTTSTGYAIGHYARWLQRGAIRVDATTDDPLVMVSAFADNKRGKASFVIINNNDAPKAVRVHVTGFTFTGAPTGEQSYGDTRWKALGAIPFDAETKDAFVVTVPAKSVTSVGGNY